MSNQLIISLLNDIYTLFSSQNGDGDTILHLALRLPNIQVADIMLRHKDLHSLLPVENCENSQPIQVAVRYNKLDALKQLIKIASGYREKCPMECKFHLLHIAADEGHFQLTQYLIEENYKYGNCPY